MEETMTALVDRSLQHLNRILRVYLILGLTGASAIFAFGAFAAYPSLAKLGIVGLLWCGIYGLFIKGLAKGEPQPSASVRTKSRLDADDYPPLENSAIKRHAS